MIYIVVLVVLGVIIVGGIVAVSRDYWEAEPVPLLAGIFAFFFALVGPLLMSSGGDLAESSRTDLGALAVGSETDGSFFLGTGVIDEEPVFTYVEDHEGYSTIETIETRDARIVEEETDTPYLVRYHTCLEAGFWIPFDTCSPTVYTEFHVPAGSIVRDYTVDVG